MACCNFCNSRDFDQLNYSLGYVSRADEEREFKAIEKAERIHEVSVQASTSEGARWMEAPNAVELQRMASASPEAALLGVALALYTLLEALSTTNEADRASKM